MATVTMTLRRVSERCAISVLVCADRAASAWPTCESVQHVQHLLWQEQQLPAMHIQRTACSAKLFMLTCGQQPTANSPAVSARCLQT